MLRYPVASATRTNLDLRWGTLHFTYVPDWYFGHATDAPGQVCRLLECGQWQLSISADGQYLTFQTPAPDGTTSAFDNQDRLFAVTNAFGQALKRVFDRNVRGLYLTDRNGVTVTNRYDSLGRRRTRTVLGERPLREDYS